MNRRVALRVWQAFCAATALALLSVSLALAAPAALAQQDPGPTASIYGIDSRDYPNVTVLLAVTDPLGAPVIGLTPADVALAVDGEPVADSPVTISSHLPAVAVALALDISADFDSFTQVQAAARDFVNTMGPDDQAALLVYQSDVSLAQEFTADKDSLLAAIDGLTAEGTATNLNRAVSQAVTLLEGLEAERKAVVAVTNGGDTVGAVSTDAVTRQAREAGVPVYTLVYSPTVNVNALRAMADGSGGRAYVLNSAEGVAASLSSAAAGLRQGYALTFQVALPADGLEHSLSVVVSVEGRETEAEAAFEAVLIATPITLALSVSEGQQVLGVVNLTAQVGSSTPIVSVEYRLDGQPLAVLDTPPYSFQWDSSAVPAGLHLLTARATDAGGRTGEAQVTLEVAEITPLLVTAFAPRSVESGQAVTVDAQVDTTAPGVTVEFLLDGEPVGRADSPPFSATFDSERFEAGDHTLTVRATDALGRRAENNISIQFTPRPLSAGERAGLFVQSLARYRRLGYSLVLVFLMFVVLLAVIVLLRMNSAARRRRLQRVCQLELANLGNARSRFELWASDAAQALKFQFSLNGEILPAREPAAAQPAAAARPARVPAGARPQPAAPAKPADGRKASDRAWSLSSTIGDLLNTLGYLVPGSAGRAMYQTSSTIRDTQYTAGRVERLGGQVADVKGQGAAQTQAATVIEEPLPPVDQTAPGPVAPRRPAQPADTHPWVETPEIEPGETLSLSLLVDRRRGSGIQQHAFQIASRCVAEGPAQKPLVEQAVLEMGRLPALLSLAPFLVLLAAAGIMLLLIALLIAPPGFVL